MTMYEKIRAGATNPAYLARCDRFEGLARGGVLIIDALAQVTRYDVRTLCETFRRYLSEGFDSPEELDYICTAFITHALEEDL